MAGKKRKSKTLRTLSREELETRIKLIPVLRERAFVSFLYLTGARISEICNKVVVGQLKDDPDNNTYLLINELEVLKKRKATIKKYGVIKRSVPINKDKDKVFVKAITDYIADLKVKDKRLTTAYTKVLFPFSRVTGYKMVRKNFLPDKLFPHYFRHLRATHLVQYFDMSQQRLTKYFGWTRSDTADWYVKLSTTDLRY